MTKGWWLALYLSFVVAPTLAWGTTTLSRPFGRTLSIAADQLGGTVTMEYEQGLNPAFSVYAGVKVLFVKGVLKSNSPESLAAGPELGVRYFLLGSAPIGLWVGPYATASFVQNINEGRIQRSVGFGLGGMAGVNFQVRRLNLSVGAGTGWTDYTATIDGRKAGDPGFAGRLRLAAGVAF